MDFTQISSSDELTALLASIDGKLANLDSLNRSRTVSLVSSMARALSHFRSSDLSAASSAVSSPIILQVVVSVSGTLTGGAQTGGSHGMSSEKSAVSFCEMGVGDEPAILGVRSVHSQVTTTRPSPDTEEFENEYFPEAAFAEGEELDEGYTAEEWAAWDAGAYDAQEYGGAREEFAEHFDSYDEEEYYSDDY
ncbi:hypothetical protein CYMTET_37746 [Cymbomonas tetramitiformis]|uniref:Uncharacterized protein n=1 Tax=Cymbomonas tetramitiformis TaxID=36881 RepID=A0AAE0F6C8_9CHLO|nr:hypothetical protein CYMTET_37746 [Cymbomonas tetramitiformis]